MTARPTEPADPEALVRRTTRSTWWSSLGGVAGIGAIPLLAALAFIGTGDAHIGIPLLGLIIAAAVVVATKVRRRYGVDGERWLAHLRSIADEPRAWHELEVWFASPVPEKRLAETDQPVQALVLIGLPGRGPRWGYRMAWGPLPKDGPARSWGPPRRGGVLLLDVGGEPVWPARPALGRWFVWLARLQQVLFYGPLQRPRP